MRTLLMLGAGRMGGALLQGWMTVGPVAMDDVQIRDPNPGEDALAAEAEGAFLNPPDKELYRADTVLLGVKPQVWREAAEAVEPFLNPAAVIVSIVAGVSSADISEAFGGRQVARVMPTTAVAVAQGTASVFAENAKARDRAHDLFEALALVADLDDEALMHAATAVSGSGPAYLYAFIEALEAAGVRAGLPEDAAAVLARSTITGAAALLSGSEENPAELRRQVTSPGGTTQAALEVLMGPNGFGELLNEAVAAAVARSKELG